MEDGLKFVIAVIAAFLIGLFLGITSANQIHQNGIEQLEKQKLELEIKKLKNQLNNL